MTRIAFTVWGVPQPKGSARAFVPKGWKRPVITSDNKSLRAWEDVIRAELQRIVAEIEPRARAVIFGAAISVTIVFYLPRPKTAARRWAPMVKPDLSKLIRGAEDALTGIVFKDDAQVVAIHAWKVYADGPSRADFQIEPLTVIDVSQQPQLPIAAVPAARTASV